MPSIRRGVGEPSDDFQAPVRKGRAVNEEAAVQGRITTFWDAVASGYDSPGNVALPGTAQYANWVEALGSALPDSSARVLDVGTGTGFVARIAAELGHRVTAIDLSAAMLEASAMTDGLEITYAVGDAAREKELLSAPGTGRVDGARPSGDKH